MAAVSQNGNALQHAALDLKTERAIVIKAVQNDGMAINHFFCHLREDPEIILTAVENNAKALTLVNASFRSDPLFVLQCAHKNIHAVDFANLLPHEKNALKIKLAEEFAEKGELTKLRDFFARHQKSAWGDASLQFGDHSLTHAKSIIKTMKEGMSYDERKAYKALSCDHTPELPTLTDAQSFFRKVGKAITSRML
jgi:hypothetical protein